MTLKKVRLGKRESHTTTVNQFLLLKRYSSCCTYYAEVSSDETTKPELLVTKPQSATGYLACLLTKIGLPGGLKRKVSESLKRCSPEGQYTVSTLHIVSSPDAYVQFFGG